MRVVTLIAMLTFVTVASARAQDEERSAPVASTQVVSASPVLWMWKWFNADYERKINSMLTWGVSGSYLPVGEFSYGRASLLVRFYPQRAALTGFYVGGQVGVYRVSDEAQREVFHAVLHGAGVDLGYAWLLGPKRNIGVSLGFGLSRLSGSDLKGASFVMPNARLVNVGFAF